MARWLLGTGQVPPSYVAAQGTVLGWVDNVHVEAAGSRLWVGGDVTTVVLGTVALP